MSLMLLNLLLVLVVPFLIAAPLFVVGRRQLAPATTWRRGHFALTTRTSHFAAVLA